MTASKRGAITKPQRTVVTSDKADVRTRILNAALALLAQGGVQEVTQPRVSKAAGVRQSHLTYYFPTIGDLLQAVVRHTLESLAAEVGAHDEAQRPASFVEAVTAASADKARVRVMLGLVTAADRDATLKPRLREFITELRSTIAPVLKSTGLDGTPEQVAFMHTVVVGAAVLQLARDNDEARREARNVIEAAVVCLRGKS